MRSPINVKKPIMPITIPAMAPPDNPPPPPASSVVLVLLLPVGAAVSGSAVIVVPAMTVVTSVVAVAAMDPEAEPMASMGAAGALDGADPDALPDVLALGGGVVAPRPSSSIMLIGLESAVCVP